jgi:hypothetical protein
VSIRTRWKNYRLRSSRRKLEEEYKRVVVEARQKKDEGLREEWESRHEWDFTVIDAEIKYNESRELRDRANRLYLPTPEFSDETKWLNRDPEMMENWYILRPEALTELRTAIRKEERERREVWESRIKIAGVLITGLTGLIGTAIGLVAVLKKWR